MIDPNEKEADDSSVDEQQKSSMTVVSITGGIGSGKTTVAQIARDAGFKVISSDDKAKELMASDPEVMSELVDEFGADTYLPDGKLNSAFIAGIVFADDKNAAKSLAKLNSIVHPSVIQSMINETARYEAEGEKLLFVESALVFEAGLEDGFDYIIVVDASEEISIERVMKRSGLTSEQVQRRIDEQIPRSGKKAHADFVISNNGSVDDLKKSATMIINIISQIA
ncbi:MAG: dephospho-CoA kinase [Chlorobi bacterium]|nr:dephospho-CoA kinase [Chlorobiota bacterium]